MHGLACRTNEAAISAAPDERTGIQIGDGLLQLGLGVHHDRPIPGDWLLDRLARDKQEPNALVTSLDRHFVAAVEQHQRAIARAFAHDRLPRRALLLGEDAERARRAGERT